MTRFSLGDLHPGQTAKISVLVRNLGLEPVETSRFETSCPCLRVVLSTNRVEPDETAALEVEFDPSQELDFRGKLTIEYTGYSLNGKSVINGHVTLSISDTVPRKSLGDVRSDFNSNSEQIGESMNWDL